MKLTRVSCGPTWLVFYRQCHRLSPIFHRFSASVYYCQRKPKFKALGIMLIGSQLKACGREKGLSFGIAVDNVMRLSELRKLVLPMSWGGCCMAMSLLGVGSLCSPISVILSIKFNEALTFQGYQPILPEMSLDHWS